MYRHFAAITLVISAALAFVVDNESRAAAQARMDALETQAQAERLAMQEKYGHAKLMNKAIEHQTSQGWADDGGFDGEYGAPMDADGARVASGSGIFGAENTLPQDLAAFGIPAAEIAQMTPEERAELLRRLHAERYGASPAQRKEQARALIASSSRRSGSTGQDL